jgi:hypothetical protein
MACEGRLFIMSNSGQEAAVMLPSISVSGIALVIASLDTGSCKAWKASLLPALLVHNED